MRKRLSSWVFVLVFLAWSPGSTIHAQGTKEFVQRQNGASAEVNFSEIRLPDQKDFGTGSLTTEYKPNALRSGQGVLSNMAARPAFQVLIAVNPNGTVMVGIGKADGSKPVHATAFTLPAKLDPAPVHTLFLNWSQWKITGAKLDGIALAETAVPEDAPKKP